jgi:serine/threonine protein kinase/predicted Zn-dependent protease
MSEPSSRDPLEVLAEEFVGRYRAGDLPSLSEYAERHPELAEQIRDLFPALLEMEQLKPGAADRTTDHTSQANHRHDHPERLGEFCILREVGRGGMGVVYEAVQESLGRHVALKVLPAGALSNPTRLERFHREARAAAKLHHTNIVPVFGTGEVEGLHYYAMQFIRGHGLDAVIDELRRLRSQTATREVTPPGTPGPTVDEAHGAGSISTSFSLDGGTAPLSGATDSGIRSTSGRAYWESVARLGAQAAGALAHSHGQGVLHRDIKPANLLLDLQGTLWVTDFGLAKIADEADLTGAGDIIGTLRYMAPERFKGHCDARSDIYALGLTLYEMLTMRPAFDETAREKLISQVTQGEPARPSRFNPDVPRDLETIVLKAVAREPEARYQSAAEMADDLRRFAEDRPIRARRASATERLRRWCRRNPTVAALAASLAAVLLVTAVAATITAFSYRNLAEKEKKAGDKLADELARLNRANGFFESGFRKSMRKDWEGAYADCTAAVEQRPDHSQVWSDRGVLLMRLGLADEAAADFDQLFKVRLPNEPAWWRFHAALRLYAGDVEGYRAVCRQMPRHYPDATSPEMVRAFAETCMLAPGGMDDPKSLVRHLEAAAAQSPAEDFSTAWAAAQFRAGEYGAVAEAAMPPDRTKMTNLPVSVLCFLAMSQARLGDAANARASLDVARDKLDTAASMLSRQSFGAKAAERYVGPYPPPQTQEDLADWLVSVLLYREAAAALGIADADHPLPLFIRARGCAALGWWDRAEDAADRAVQLCLRDEKSPQIPVAALVEHARLRAARGHWEDVAADLGRAAKLPRTSYPLTDEAVKLFTAYGRDADARAHLTAALAAEPGNLALRVELARVCVRMEDCEAAAADFDKVLNILPQPGSYMPPRKGFGGGMGGWSGGMGGWIGGGFGGGFESYFSGSHVTRVQGNAPGLSVSQEELLNEVVRHDELYSRVTKLRPDDSLLRRERGRFLTHGKRWPDAVKHYEDWVSKAPNAQVQINILTLVAEDVAAHDNVFEPLSDRWPHSEPLWRARAKRYLERGDVEKAADALAYLFQDGPGVAGAGVGGGLGRAGFPNFVTGFGNPVYPSPGSGLVGREYALSVILQSEKLFDAVAAKRPDDAEPWLARFRQSVSLGKWDDVAAAAREVARRSQGDPATLRALGDSLAASPRFDLAAEYYRASLAIQPENTDVWLALCRSSVRLKKWDEAAEAFDGAVRHPAQPGKPGTPAPAMYDVLPQTPEVLREFATRRPDDAALWLRWGRLLANEKKWEEALEPLGKAAALAQDNPDIWAELARVHITLKKWKDASADLDNIVRHTAPPGKPGLSAATIYMRLPLFTEETMEELSSLRPNDGTLWQAHGRLLAVNRNMPAAVAAFDKAATLMPKNADVLVDLARAQLGQSKMKEAADAYDKALKVQPPIPYPQNWTNPPQLPQTLYTEIVSRSFFPPQQGGGRELFKALTELRPDDGRLWFEYCRALGSASPNPNMPLGQRSEIRNALEEMVKRAPKEPVARLERANFRASDGEPEKAVEDYVAAAEILAAKQPIPQTGWKMYYDIAASPKVFDGFTSARKDDPFPWLARANRRSQNPLDPNYASWEADMDRALEIRPKDAVILNARRWAYMELGQWDKAVKEYAAEIERQEPAAGAWLWVESATGHAAAGDADRYRNLCRRMEEVWKTQDSPAARQQLALSVSLLPGSAGSARAMLEHAQQAADADPKSAWNAITLALAYYRLEQYEEAVAASGEYRKKANKDGFGMSSQDRAVLDLVTVLAVARSGKKDEARQLFRSTCKTMDEILIVQGRRRRVGPGHAWAIATVLRREAEALLKD